MYRIVLPWQGCVIVVGASVLMWLLISLMASAAAGSAWEGSCSIDYKDEAPYFFCGGEEGEPLSGSDELAWFRARQPKTAECSVVHGTFSSVDCTFNKSSLTSEVESVE